MSQGESGSRYQSEPAPLRVLIADSQAIVRSGIRLLLETTSDVTVTGEAATAKEAVAQFRALRPDLLLLDPEMPDIQGETAIQTIKKSHPEACVLILTSDSEPEAVLGALRAGADGYLLKGSDPNLLPRLVRDVCDGKVALDPAVTPALLQEIQRPSGAENDPAEGLTDREMEVLLLVARGLPNQDIADRLVISERTVRTHVGHILDKLNLNNRTQAALFALRHGWASLDE